MKKWRKLGIACIALILMMVYTGLAWGAPKIYLLTEQERAATHATHLMVVEGSDLTETNVDTAETFDDCEVLAKQGVEVVAVVLKEAFATGDTNYTDSLTMVIGDGTDDDLFLESMQLAGESTEVWLKYGRGSWQTAATSNAITALGTPTTANAITGFGAHTTAAVISGFGAHTTADVLTNFSLTMQTTTGYDSTGAVVTNAAGAEIAFVTNVTVSFETDTVLVTLGTPTTEDAITALGTPTTSAAITGFGAHTTVAAVTGVTQSEGRKVYTSDDTIDLKFTPNSEYSTSQFTDGKVAIYFRVWDAR